MHASLDIVEERIAAQRQTASAPGGSRPDSYLGMLYPIEELSVYGYLTNSRVKLLTVIDDDEVKDVEMRALFRRHVAGAAPAPARAEPVDAFLVSLSVHNFHVSSSEELGICSDGAPVLRPSIHPPLRSYEASCRAPMPMPLDHFAPVPILHCFQFARLHTLYADTVSNPFHNLDGELHGCASFERQVERIVEAGLY